jgi:hypothetical protein
MKKLLFLIFCLSFSTYVCCQNAAPKIFSIKNQIDSLVIKYNIKEINVVCSEGMQLKPSNDFYIDKGFLVVDKMSFFNLDKLISFHIVRNAWSLKHSIQFVFQ